MAEERKVIDEANYSYQAQEPRPSGPAVVGRGGDPLFMNIRASKQQLVELLDETSTIQDWIQRETCNNVAISYLKNENLKEIYFEIKDGFGDYGPLILMGFKTPQGVEIPRLKILDKEGNVQEVLTGPFVIDELNRRAIAYREFNSSKYEAIELPNETEVVDIESVPIEEYSGNIQEYNG